MTKESMIAKLNRKDITGVGVKVTTSEGYEIYYFYEDFGEGELSPTCRGGGFVRRLVFKFPPKIRQPLFLQACPLRHYRIGLLSPQRYFFLKYSMHR